MIAIPTMDMFRFDRDNSRNICKTRGGGVACYFRKDLQLSVLLLPELSHVCKDIEIMTLRCRYPFGKVIHMMGYLPTTNDDFFIILSNYIEKGR